MPLQLNAEKFKKDYIEQKSSQGINPEAMNKHMSEIYGREPVYSTVDTLGAREQATAICNRMQNLGMGNFAQLMDKFQPNMSAVDAKMADSIKETMEGIAYVVESSNDPAKVAAQFKDRNFICKEGTLTNLQAMLGEMSLSSAGVESYFTEQKKQLVTQTANDMYRKGEFSEYPWAFRQFQGMEIHNVTSLTNAVAPEYGLLAKTKEEDKYLKDISSRSRDKLSRALDQKLQSEEVINSVLDGVAMNVNFNLPVYDKETYKGDIEANQFGNSVGEAIKTLKLVDKEGNDIIRQETLVELENYKEQGYKKNVESILKDAVTIHLHEKGVIDHPDIEFVKFKIAIESSLDMNGNLAIEKDTLDQAQDKGLLEKSMKYIIDNDLKLEEDSCGMQDPVKYAIDNNIKIDGKDAKLYALDHTIDAYLRTQNPAEKKLLEEKYKAIHQIGVDKPVELLGVDSNLGKFVDSTNSAKVMAEYKGIKGLSAIESIDYTKCELPLIEKCVKATEQSNKEKPRDYDKFSTIQKVAFGVSFVLGPVAGLVYYAIKSHNAAEKKAVESKLDAPIDSIHKDLVKISKSSTAYSTEHKEEVKIKEDLQPKADIKAPEQSKQPVSSEKANNKEAEQALIKIMNTEGIKRLTEVANSLNNSGMKVSANNGKSPTPSINSKTSPQQSTGRGGI